MAVKYYCDRCQFECGQAEEDGRLGAIPRTSHKITPGYVGTKLVCDSCYKLWTEQVQRFFQKQGQ